MYIYTRTEPQEMFPGSSSSSVPLTINNRSTVNNNNNNNSSRTNSSTVDQRGHDGVRLEPNNVSTIGIEGHAVNIAGDQLGIYSSYSKDNQSAYGTSRYTTTTSNNTNNSKDQNNRKNKLTEIERAYVQYKTETRRERSQNITADQLMARGQLGLGGGVSPNRGSGDGYRASPRQSSPALPLMHVMKSTLPPHALVDLGLGVDHNTNTHNKVSAIRSLEDATLDYATYVYLDI